MKLAYLILAHKNLNQLYKLINTLNYCENVDFYIHIDKRVNIKELKKK